MSKRKLGEVVKQQQERQHKTPWDLASEVMDEQTKASTAQVEPEQRQVSRTTDRISISLLKEERHAIENRALALRQQGHRDLKTSRIARIAFQMLLDASDEDILDVARRVPNLEKLRAGKRSDGGTVQ